MSDNTVTIPEGEDINDLLLISIYQTFRKLNLNKLIKERDKLQKELEENPLTSRMFNAQPSRQHDINILDRVISLGKSLNTR